MANAKLQNVLAIESSCDETSVAILGFDGRILAQKTLSQIETHRKHGGVVPEVASRQHFEDLDGLVGETLAEAGLSLSQIDSFAATFGPGLIGPLLVGASYARGLASGLNAPLLGVHHLRGHLASVLLESSLSGNLRERADNIFPALVLLVSGGHTQILSVDADLSAHRLADTADDAAGECFDKSAKLMGLPYPGGPQIERLAEQIDLKNPTQKKSSVTVLAMLPRPRSEAGFSFSGLKTAVRVHLQKCPEDATNPAFAWALQECISITLEKGLDRAIEKLGGLGSLKNFVFCGGVSANQRIRERLLSWAERRKLGVFLPPLSLCTDNAAMIGAAALVQAPRLCLHDVVARQEVDLDRAE